MYVKSRGRLGSLGDSPLTIGESINLSFQLNAAGQTYFAATNLANLGLGADLSAIESTLEGWSLFANGVFNLANAQWDNPTTPSVLTLTLTVGSGGPMYALSGIGAAVADMLNNYFGNIGGATFTYVGAPGTGTQTVAQAVASNLTVNPVVLAQTAAQALSNPNAPHAPPPAPTPSLPTWFWWVAGAGALLAAVAATN